MRTMPAPPPSSILQEFAAILVSRSQGPMAALPVRLPAAWLAWHGWAQALLGLVPAALMRVWLTAVRRCRPLLRHRQGEPAQQGRGQGQRVGRLGSDWCWWGALGLPLRPPPHLPLH